MVKTIVMVPWLEFVFTNTNLSTLLYSDSLDEEGSGIDSFTEAGSGVLSVATVTRSPDIFFRRTTTESEAVGELFTQRPTGVDFTYTESPSELPLPQPPSFTEVIREEIKAVTAQPNIGREPSRSFVIPPTGQ